MVALGLLGVGLQLLPQDPSRAVERAPASGPASTGATVAASPPATPRPTSTPTRERGPRPARTDGQRAAGLRADGSAYRVPARGDGRFTGARTSQPSSARSGRLIRFDVQVEHGLGVDADAAALLMAEVLDDERSWRGTERVRFALVARGERADLHAYLATPGTTDRLCAPLLTRGRFSCQNGRRVVLYLSQAPFPEPDHAHPLGKEGGPWMAREGAVAVLCSMPASGRPAAPLLVVGPDEELVTHTAEELGAL